MLYHAANTRSAAGEEEGRSRGDSGAVRGVKQWHDKHHRVIFEGTMMVVSASFPRQNGREGGGAKVEKGERERER